MNKTRIYRRTRTFRSGEFWNAMHSEVRQLCEKALNMPKAGRPQGIYSWEVYTDMHTMMSDKEHASMWMPLNRGLAATINGEF